jgi:putative tryptophan/tyrosine transport system substrate-binding protein
MRRREFITLIGGALAAKPSVMQAQQSALKRIGVVVNNEEHDSDGQARVTAFREGLGELGWIEGHNCHLDYRWGAGDPDRARDDVAELISLSPDIILANGTIALSALQKITQTMPIVFVVVTDPVGAGFVQSLARPGGNITGFSTFEPEIGGKWLEILHEASPETRRVAVLFEPGFQGFAALLQAVERLAPSMGITTSSVAFRDPSSDIETAIAAFAKDGMGGLIVLPSGTNTIARKMLFELALRYHLPAVYPFRLFAIDGGLMAYGFDPRDLFRRGASYVDRVLKGEKPADLPVQAPTKYELVINLKTAKATGVAIPGTMLARADDVIE